MPEPIDYSRYLKIPWKDKGRDWSGCDCWGLGCLFNREECGVVIKSVWFVARDCHDIHAIRAFMEQEKKSWESVKRKDPRKGDIVDLSVSENTFHVGVVIHPGWMMHIEERGWPQILELKDKRIAGRIRKGSGYWRYNGAD